LDLSRAKVKEVLQETANLKTHLMMGFNQRFDNNFSNVNKQVRSGKIGDIHTLHIISRDPAPPPVSYILSSGGLFMDMSIHDFDMARFITGSEVVEVFAKGYNLVDPEIGKAGDIDTAVVLLTFKNKATAIIENSRKAVYGYDQRLEVFGSAGMIKVENPLKDQSIFYNEGGGQSARHLDFFMDRYLDSYVKEMDAFIQSILNNEPVPVTGEDALKAMNIAEAANLSVKENRPVSLV
jgi:myo-inositol 2-dehydrogenase/D-chiro-inositol 1-dehydrogenase